MEILVYLPFFFFFLRNISINCFTLIFSSFHQFTHCYLYTLKIAAYFVAGPDIGKFTIKAAEDYRTVDKCVHFRPQCNYFNMNELASLWETKIGRTLPKITITEDALLAVAAGLYIFSQLFNNPTILPLFHFI